VEQKSQINILAPDMSNKKIQAFQTKTHPLLECPDSLGQLLNVGMDSVFREGLGDQMSNSEWK